MAQNVEKRLVIWSKDDTKVAYAFSEEPRITFTETNMIVTTDLIVANYKLENLSHYTYELNESSGVKAIEEERMSIKSGGDYLVFSLVEEGASVTITSVSGYEVIRKKPSVKGEFAISLAELKEDVYIVSINGKVIYKFIKK